MFGRLFGTGGSKKGGGSKSATKAPSLNDSIQQLRKAVTQLDKREEHLEKKN